jgi:Ca2+/H+ antiporter
VNPDLLCRIQFPMLVWIACILSVEGINVWKTSLLVSISVFNLLDLLVLFLSFFLIYMVSTQGKSTYFSGLCLILYYVAYLLINYYE